jgi:hypothetical protein
MKELLQMCFLVFVENRLYSEREIADDLAFIKGAADRGWIHPIEVEGALSIQYYQEELLGPDFWTEIGLFGLPIQDLLRGEAYRTWITGHNARLVIRPRGAQLLYELDSAHPSVERHIERQVPVNLFAEAWLLMSYRLRSFRHYISNQRDSWPDKYLTDPRFYTPEIAQLISENQVRAIGQGNLAEVLRTAECTKGYLYDPVARSFTSAG